MSSQSSFNICLKSKRVIQLFRDSYILGISWLIKTWLGILGRVGIGGQGVIFFSFSSSSWIFLCFITKMIWPVSFSRTTQWGQQEWQWGQEGVPPEILSTPQEVQVQVQVQDQGHLIIWRSSKISKSFCICVSIKSAVKTCRRYWGRINASLHTAACLLFYCLFFAIVAASVFPILGDNDLFRVYPLHRHPAMASTCVVVFLYGGLTVNCG